MFKHLTVTKLKNKLQELEDQGHGDKLVIDYENEDCALTKVTIEDNSELDYPTFGNFELNVICFHIDMY